MSKSKYKTTSYGGTQFERIVPEVKTGEPLPRVLNIRLTLEQALMLKLALSACALEINSLNRAKKSGRSVGITLAVKPDLARIDVLEGRVP